MIEARDFIDRILDRQYSFCSGVPCSFLTPFINFVISSDRVEYVGAASEGEAVGIAFGAHLTGRKTVVICQNSGLGNMVNPLTSLNYPFRAPTLIIVTHRGAPGLKDEPQHTLPGMIIEDLLNALRIPWQVFPDRTEQIDPVLNAVEDYFRDESLPYALIMKKGSVAPYTLGNPEQTVKSFNNNVEGEFVLRPDSRMVRYNAIRIIREVTGQAGLLIGTTGKIGRELFALGHKANQIYIVGSMGCASGIGLGVSLCQDKRKVIVLDGDGAALMKMGTLATIGHYQPENLLHIILDNEAHESTGGQATVSDSVDFALASLACSYRTAFRCDTEDDLKGVIERAFAMKGPALVHVKVAVGSDPSLPRPNLTPEEVKRQFMEYIAQ